MENPVINEAAVPPKKYLAVGVLPAGLQNFFPRTGWAVIAPYVEEVAAMTKGEYSASEVAVAIDAGLCHFHIGYLCDKELTDTEQQGYVVQKLASASPGEGFAGYFLLRLQPGVLHIWQVYIVKELRGQMEIFNPGFERIKKAASLFRVNGITMSGNREQWHGIAEKLGFAETMTIYKLDVKAK